MIKIYVATIIIYIIALGVDYMAFATTTITISSGNAAGDTFSTPILIVNDNIFEPAESFTAAINANPVERLFPIEGRATATANILDDDGLLMVENNHSFLY